MRHRSVTLGLTLLAYVVAILQRPGELIAETKVDLYLDPSRFLSNVLSVWSPTVDLGHVFGAQYSGYAWPMAPWMVAGDALGLPVWLTHRLWIGTLLAVAAVGVVRLLTRLAPERGSLPVGLAGLLYAINPYTTVYIDRTSITLLTYAALPWLLLAVERGLRSPRGWRWPVVFGLILTSTGGGVNVAVTAWVLLGPLAFALYMWWLRDIDWRALWSWGWRLALAAGVLQLWWLIPVAIQALAAPNFLPFTEQPGTIWSTTSLSESLRLMGFWTSYVGVGYGGVLAPFQSSATAMLYLLPIVIAGLWAGAGGLLSSVLLRRWRYAPFFFMLAVGGLVIMSVGWPEGTPLRKVVTGVYYRLDTVDAFRTSYKAGALAALGLSVLAGLGAGTLLERVQRPRARIAAAVATAAIVALAAWPLVTGRAVERQLAFSVPSEWHELANDLEARRDDTRAMQLPGALFGYQRWGGTVDPVLPALTERPTISRWIVPYGDLRATDLQWLVDGLVSQGRARPGQLASLLDLMSVGTVVLAADGDRARSGEVPVGDGIREVLAQALGRPVGYGPVVDAAVAAGSPDEPPRTNTLLRIERGAPPILSVLPWRPATIVDGGAGGIGGLAAFGQLDPRRPLFLAPDVEAAELRRQAVEGANLVVSDTNRRRAYVPSKTVGARGPVLPAGEGLSVDGTMVDPWVGFADNQTVAELRGIESVTAPSSPQITQFPERRPFAALDGDPATAWLADRTLEQARHRITVRFGRSIDVGSIRLLPYSDSRAVVRKVSVNGNEFSVGRGWNTLRLSGGPVSELTVAITEVTEPKDANAGAGGIRELQIPGVRVTERLRPPVRLTSELRGADISKSSLTYLLDRVSADRPAQQSKYVGARGAALLRDAQDPEPVMRRVLDVPVTRPARVEAWAAVGPQTTDAEIDALHAGGRRIGPLSAASSSRFAGQGRFRASGAFDRGPRAWVGEWIAGRSAWIAWSTPRPVTLGIIRLKPPAGIVTRLPTSVTVAAGSRQFGPLPVRSGVVRLPRPVRASRFRLTINDAAFPASTPGRLRQRRAVGIGEIEGAGIPSVQTSRSAKLQLACGSAAIDVGGSTVRLGGTVDRVALDRGRGVLLRECGGRAVLRTPRTEVTGLSAPLRVDAVRLYAAPTADATDKSEGGGQVTAPGDAGRDGGRTDAAVDVQARAWLSFGQSYNRLWRARCDGRDLGEPVPIQGYANGWPLDRSCKQLDLGFAPQGAVRIGYLISGVGVLAAILLLLLAWRRREEEPATITADLAEPELPEAMPLKQAILGAMLPAVLIAACFGLRAGAVALPVFSVVRWKAVSDRALTAAAAGLMLVAVPLTYVIVQVVQGTTTSGNSTDYANDRLAAHWMTLTAIVLLAVIMKRTLSTARGRGADRSASRP